MDENTLSIRKCCVATANNCARFLETQNTLATKIGNESDVVFAFENFYFFFNFHFRYTFCQKCFNDIPGDTVTLGDEQSQSQT